MPPKTLLQVRPVRQRRLRLLAGNAADAIEYRAAEDVAWTATAPTTPEKSANPELFGPTISRLGSISSPVADLVKPMSPYFGGKSTS